MFVRCGDVVLSLQHIVSIAPKRLESGKWVILAQLEEKEDVLCLTPTKDLSLIKSEMSSVCRQISDLIGV